MQIGDGRRSPTGSEYTVAWDFRADDMAAGGQGAPLAPVFHRALAETAGLARPVLFLNLGGVANVTYVGAGDELIAFDTGPGNALLDDWMLARTGRPFDADGQLAASGTPSAAMLAKLLAHPYFALPPPKSLDRDAFASLMPTALSDADGAATLLHFSARAVAAALEHLPAAARRLLRLRRRPSQRRDDAARRRRARRHPASPARRDRLRRRRDGGAGLRLSRGACG